MVGGNYCSVYGCLNSSKKQKNLIFHGLPSDKVRLAAWLECIQRPDIHEKGKGQRVCSIHFEPKMYKNKKLLSDAIPTLNLPGSSTSHTGMMPNLEKGVQVEASDVIGVQQLRTPDFKTQYTQTDSPEISKTVQIKNSQEICLISAFTQTDFPEVKLEYFPESTSLSVSTQTCTEMHPGESFFAPQNNIPPKHIDLQTTKHLSENSPRNRKLKEMLRESEAKRRKLNEEFNKLVCQQNLNQTRISDNDQDKLLKLIMDCQEKFK